MAITVGNCCDCTKLIPLCDCVPGALGPIQTWQGFDVQDAEQKQNAANTVIVNDNDLQFGLTAGNNDRIGAMRFVPNIPQGSVITDARIQFTVDSASLAASNLVINAEATDNSPAFTTAGNSLLTRPKTTASVAWAPPTWPTVGARTAAQLTPNIAPVVQEVIDRAGWTEGNALAIHIDGTGLRDARSFMDGPPNAPELIIQYQAPGEDVCTPFYREFDEAGAPTGNDYQYNAATNTVVSYTVAGTVKACS